MVAVKCIEPRIGGFLDLVHAEGAVVVGIPLLHESVDVGGCGLGLRHCPKRREHNKRRPVVMRSNFERMAILLAAGITT